MNDEFKWACCFCGKEILKTKFDPGSLSYTPAYEARGEKTQQGLYCHAKCLEARLHPSVKLYALDLMKDSDS
ncbi:MAG: hypothetical protein KGL74_03655 [Elusimicrobia bacterium]|nr:hypothetical protein [Elusimicrobiota bacterium]MDE2510197.1 hypothetical protein [Elusimicrobiota bacterium]